MHAFAGDGVGRFGIEHGEGADVAGSDGAKAEAEAGGEELMYEAAGVPGADAGDVLRREAVFTHEPGGEGAVRVE